jgi:hypothetical protein
LQRPSVCQTYENLRKFTAAENKLAKNWQSRC